MESKSVRDTGGDEARALVIGKRVALTASTEPPPPWLSPHPPHSWSGARLLSPPQPLPCEEHSEPRPCPPGSLYLTVTSREGLQYALRTTRGCAGHRWLDKCPWTVGGLHKEQEGAAQRGVIHRNCPHRGRWHS